MSGEIRIVFMGTPEFAVPSLDILFKNNYRIVAVVTTPDKPAGRGRKITPSPVKKYALGRKIKVMQPANLKDPEFISELKSLDANLQVVVAFRMLPEIVWKMPVYGTFNLHASLLPQYRGAAPINWAIINGETVTGITTFFIDEKIDTGRLILQEKLQIGNSETAGELHDRLMLNGAELVLKTVKIIEQDRVRAIPQSEKIAADSILKAAPKIFKEDTLIDWKKTGKEIYNLIRGLSPHPGAYTHLISPEKERLIAKIYRCEFLKNPSPAIASQSACGNIETDQKSYLFIACSDGFIAVKEIQIEGKRRMEILEFLKGFHFQGKWTAGS